MSEHPGLAHWHRVMQAGNQPADLAELIAENAVFHSPVVHTPQQGRAKVIQYLAAAGQVLGSANFRYVRELVDGDEALLEFVDELDGIKINGIDLIRFDRAGKIVDFKVMVRPLKAVNKLWELMGAQLERAAASGPASAA
jgi:predicted SnoaL-like aldol condensation-catalyzing enzyme